MPFFMAFFFMGMAKGIGMASDIFLAGFFIAILFYALLFDVLYVGFNPN